VTPCLSFHEVAALARRAARGGGLTWDLADEAGRAVRMLCVAGVDGCAALAALLAELRARRAPALAPLRLSDPVWVAQAGALCPIRAGTALSDMTRDLPHAGVGLQGVIAPVLVLPFAADAARALQRPVTLSWRDGIVSIGPEGLPRAAGIAKLARARQADLHLHPGGPGLPVAPPETRARPDPAAWQALAASAARTLAPSGDGQGPVRRGISR